MDELICIFMLEGDKLIESVTYELSYFSVRCRNVNRKELAWDEVVKEMEQLRIIITCTGVA